VNPRQRRKEIHPSLANYLSLHNPQPTHPLTHTVSLPPVPCRTTKARLHPSVHALRSPQQSPAARPPPQSLARPPARRNDHPSNLQDSKSKATWRWPFSANHSVPTTPFIIPFPSLGCCCCVAGRQSVRPSLSAVHRRRAGCCVSGGCYTVPPQSPSHSLTPSIPPSRGTGQRAVGGGDSECSLPTYYLLHVNSEMSPTPPSWRKKAFRSRVARDRLIDCRCCLLCHS
jgi:hypothetical protein